MRFPFAKTTAGLSQGFLFSWYGDVSAMTEPMRDERSLPADLQ